MPGTNGGTGYPVALKCWACRRSGLIDVRPGRGLNLEATGETRPVRRIGIRETNRKIQYWCRDCGHVGWTQHIDAEILMTRLGEGGL